MAKSRNRKVLVLCEDLQAQMFTRRALVAYGFHKRSLSFIELPSKAGGGAGHAWVRTKYPEALKDIRRAGAATALIVHIDADNHTVSQRHDELRQACILLGVEPRADTEPVAELVPRRNIETWIYALDEKLAAQANVNLDDVTAFPKLVQKADCKEAAEAFAEHAQHHTTPDTTSMVPSLIDGLEEFRRTAPED
jgi:hypothetical protein